MVTSGTWGRRKLFAKERWARLLIETLYHYRGTAYVLHEFVVLPDHFHILFTPTTSLERAVQFIKGGFSHRAKIELKCNMEVWQKGFSDHRIRGAEDYAHHREYIRQNPVKKHFCDRAEDFPYSSAHPGFELDEFPQRLKPLAMAVVYGAAEAAPFQRSNFTTPDGSAEASPLATDGKKNCAAVEPSTLRTTKNSHAQTH